MKRIVIVTIFHCIFVFLGLFLYVWYQIDVPELIPGQEITFRLITTLNLFLDWMPAILCSAYIVGYASAFGKDGKHIMVKFSPYIMSRFKHVAIFALVGTTVVVCCQEICTPLIQQKLNRMKEAPALYDEYLAAAKEYQQEGDLVFAVQYAIAAEQMNPNSAEAITLKSDLEVQLEGSSYEDAMHTALLAQENMRPAATDRNITSHELLQKAQNAYNEENWIDSHYYSILAQKVAEPGSANETDAKIMAADAWNMLDDPGRFENDAVEEQYRLKKLAYSHLISGNVVEAYYSFSELLQRYPDDEDIARYYAAAALEMEAQYFFLDEIPISYGLEDRRDVAFRLKQQDGSEILVFIKGLSSVGNTGGLVQYARGLTLYEFSKNGRFKKSLYVPHAKILSQTIASLDTRSQQDLAFTDLDMEKGTVPMVMLESVDRIRPDSLNKPTYTFAPGESQATRPIITLPIDYKDFLMLKNTSHNPREMMLIDAINMSFKAPEFGYAQVVYAQDVCSRMSKPFLYIVAFIFAACIGWNYRIMSNTFKFSWVLIPALLTVGIYALLKLGQYAQILLNYGLFGFFQFATVPIIFVLSLILVFLASLFFVARRSQ